MAQLDRLLSVMAGNRNGVLALDEGTPARLESTGTDDSRPVTRAPLTGPQIVSLLREVAPPDAALRLDRGTPAAFDYVSGGDVFSTQAEIADGRWRVRIGSAAVPPLALVEDVEDTFVDGVTTGSAPSASERAAVVDARSPAHDRIDELLRTTVARGASDLHLRVGQAPMLRCHGEILRLDGARLGAGDIAALVDATMSGRARAEFAETWDADYAYEIANAGRFRANAFRDRTGVAAVFRHIPPAVVTVEELALPGEIQRLCALTRGLVLVTGPTGSGKSTTLCALVDLVNRTRSDHIITIEDPIEFVHPSQRCVVSQREVGQHTRSFKTALRAALREDPDVVLIGEMRDLETVSIALETAETGHLVFATLHTTTAAMTIDRIIDQFPADQQEQIRVMLADSLRGVISQTLCKKIGGGRVAAREVLFNTASIANLIRERKTFQIPAIVQTSKRLGMLTMADALVELVVTGQVAPVDAYTHAPDKTSFVAAMRAKNLDVATLESELGYSTAR